MPHFDLPLSALQTYRPEVREPADFDEFWDATIREARAAASDPAVDQVETPLTTLDVFDVTFSGFAGDPVKAWLTVPKNAEGPLPAVVEFNGYGGGRGLPVERLAWASAGYAHLFMDTRGQGAGWGSGGATSDPHGTSSGHPGSMTRGIEDPSDYYYRRVFADAVRAVDTARSLSVVDASRVAVCGASQGGGIALAAGALSGDLVAVMPDVPFLCHFERAVGLTDENPYHEIVRYLSVYRGREERVFETLSYFDGVNMAKRITAPALFSVGLMDPVCPPSTVYAAFNHCAASDKDIAVYNFNQHEGGAVYQWVRQAEFLSSRA